MRIIVLGTRGFPHVQGGVEVHCQNLYSQLVKLGCEIIVFTRKTYVDVSIKEYKGVKLVALPSIRHKSLEAFLHTFTGILAALRYAQDILHIHGIGPSLFTPLARILGIKVVITSHGSNYKHLKWGKFAKLILRFGELLGIFYANEVIAISENIADEIKKKYNRDVTVIPNGVTVQKILQTEDALKKYHLEKGKYLLAVGRFVPEKGFHDLIDAYCRLPLSRSEERKTKDENWEKEEEWKLVIVGRADHEDKYSSDLKIMAGRNSNIVLTGFLTGEPLQELYSHAGLFVLPSYYEGLPIALLEALSYGLSCIASDIPSNRNMVSTTRLFEAGNVKALAGAIRKFKGKPLSKEERNAQRRMVTERYDWGKIADRTIEVYNQNLAPNRNKTL